MQIRLYNSLSRKVQNFSPLNEQEVRMYSCGPTVYNHAHIGNLRAFLFADLMQRVMKNVGEYDVKWVMNVTNIDDKTIRDSKVGSLAWRPEMGEQTDDPLANLNKFTKYYETKFFEDLAKIGIKREDLFEVPKATDYIPHMQNLIKKIYEKGLAYEAGGSVYFDVAKWRKIDIYGRLKKLDFDNMKANLRVDTDQYEREQVSDFVLWKAKKDGEPFWNYTLDSMKLPGRPGWHIECSAMEYELLGLPFDIHTGGIDLQFPHHEDEIAQSKAGYGVDPTLFWCHNEFLEVEGEKMSKSKGNFYTINDLIAKGIDPLDIRYAMLASHYASVYNFTFSGVAAAAKARARVQEFIYELFDPAKSGTKRPDVKGLNEVVFGALSDDLHTPKALGELFTFINKTDIAEIDPKYKEKLIEFFTKLNNIFEVWKLEELKEEVIEIPDYVTRMAELRLEAKRNKNYATADLLRTKIEDEGFVVKDTKEGYEILPKK